MWKIQDKYFLDTKISLAHMLLCGVQTLTINPKPNYENQTYFRFVPTQEQGVTELHLLFQQAHLQPTESVFQNVLAYLMDQCYMYAI